MAPMRQLPEDVGIIAGILAAITGVWFAITGQSEKRIRELAVISAEESGKFVLAAKQEQINRALQDDVSEIKGTVRDIHNILMRTRDS